MPFDTQQPPATLTRSSVAERRRARLLDATIEVAGERGWEAMTLAEVVARAGLSKRTVYDLFEDKRACFLAAARELIDRVSALTLAEYRAAKTPRDGVEASVRALLRFCGESPAAARVYLVEIAAAGPDGAALWREHMDSMSRRAAQALEPLRGDLPAHAGSMAVGGVYTVARARLLAGQARQLPALAPEVTEALCIALGIDPRGPGPAAAAGNRKGEVVPLRRERRPGQLAGGPHGMPREQVEANQSRRILAAMGELIAEHGYERTTVELVIARAGVSRKTFYDLRGGREQWFLLVCDAAADRLLARLDAHSAPSGERRGHPADRAQRAAAALIDFCIDDPAGARICFVETLAARADARAWRDALLDRVTAALAPGAAANGDPAAAADGQRAKLAASAAVGAVLELAGRRPEPLDRDYATTLVTKVLAAGSA